MAAMMVQTMADMRVATTAVAKVEQMADMKAFE